MIKDFFVSYNTKDKDWAEWIAYKLEDQGYRTILQAWDFRPGNDFVLRMQEATTQSKTTIAVLSEDYLASLYTQPEWATAFARDPVGHIRTLLPIRVADCHPQGMLTSRIYADLVGLDEHEASEELIKSLRERAKPELAPPFPGNSRGSGRTDARNKVPFPGSSVRPPSLIQETRSPLFLDERTRLLSEELSHAYLRKKNLSAIRESTSAVEEEIKDLKRQLRLGGQLKPGDQLADGRYLLLTSLGHGGFATVWKARDNKLNCHVAIKVLHSSCANHAVSRERFFRGARIMVELNDPDGIVSVLAPKGEDDGYFYFVMEMLDAGNLKEAVDRKVVTPDRAVDIMDRILEILARTHAHSNKYIHRDIKPTNILLTRNGLLKITDFDLAWADDTTGGTQSGMLGTFGYASPEQLDRPQAIDHRADIYSVAVTGLFVLSGGQIDRFAIIRNPGRFIDGLPTNEQLKRVLRHAMELNPEDRISSAEEFRRALRDACNFSTTQIGTRSKRASLKQKGTTPKQKKRYTIPDIPTRKINEALEMFDRDFRDRGRWRNFSSNPKHRYAISHDGNLYPIKLIVSLATGIPIGHFSGGIPINKSIVKKGFNVISLQTQGFQSGTVADPIANRTEAESQFATISPPVTVNSSCQIL